MASLIYVLFPRDNSEAGAGKSLSGLTPTWQFFVAQGTGQPLPSPSIVDAGNGHYEVTYDPEASGPARGRIDFGDAVPQPSDRYVDFVAYRADSRVEAMLDAPVSTVANPPSITVPAPIVNYTPPAITVNPPAVTVEPPPVNVAAPDLSAIRADLATLQAAIPDAATIASHITEHLATAPGPPDLSTFADQIAAAVVAAIVSRLSRSIPPDRVPSPAIPPGPTLGT